MNELSIIAPMAVIIFLGWCFPRFGILPRETFQDINKILYWLAIPALLIRLTARADLSTLGNWNLFFAIYAGYCILPLIAWGAGRAAGEKRERLAISVLVSMRSNQVFMGIPVVSIAMGTPGLEALSIYLAVSLVGYHIISISSSQLVLSGGISPASIKNSLIKVLTNPMVLACFIGIFFSFKEIHVFPRPVDTTLKVLGDIGTGLALLSIGAKLEVRALPSLLKTTWRDSAVKLLVQPGVVWGLFLLLPVSPAMMKAVVLVSAMPVAVNSLVVAHGMGMDDRYAGEVITLSTILSVVTIPLWIRLLGL
ncbi:MAG: AEC family transporter [Synergistaceae bacterium]|nr:AEC family transporter [Synergistaceae bacterium]